MSSLSAAISVSRTVICVLLRAGIPGIPGSQLQQDALAMDLPDRCSQCQPGSCRGAGEREGRSQEAWSDLPGSQEGPRSREQAAVLQRASLSQDPHTQVAGAGSDPAWASAILVAERHGAGATGWHGSRSPCMCWAGRGGAAARAGAAAAAPTATSKAQPSRGRSLGRGGAAGTQEEGQEGHKGEEGKGGEGEDTLAQSLAGVVPYVVSDDDGELQISPDQVPRFGIAVAA